MAMTGMSALEAMVRQKEQRQMEERKHMEMQRMADELYRRQMAIAPHWFGVDWAVENDPPKKKETKPTLNKLLLLLEN